jgi:carboxyl-terminal processing protease
MFKKNKIISLGKFFTIILGILLFATACKKDPKISSTTTPVVPIVIPTRAQLTMDSIYLYAKDTYYWNDQMPTYDGFKPRTYSNNQSVLDAIRALPGTGKPFWTTNTDPVPREKYSFLDDGSLSTSLGGVSGDFGFSVFYNSAEDLRIKFVSPNSPASATDLKRGYQITILNGRSGADLSSAVPSNISFVSNAVFGSGSTVSLTVKKPDGSTQNLTIARASYANNPIFSTKMFNVGSKKVGYIVYNSFTTNSSDALTNAISKIQTDGATELIVDLRYNGGGSVATAEVLTNLLAPASANGQVMYTTFWTKTMQDGLAKILANQPLWDRNGKLQVWTSGVNGKWATYADLDYRPTAGAGNLENFNKIGSAEFKKIYFLVLSGSASASELVINNLKGVMGDNIKLIGRKTNGKPVGFFALKIDNLDLYIPQFETKNQKNEGGYYAGLTVDKDLPDDVTKDFGDPNESLLAAALSYSDKGVFSISSKGNTLSSLSPISVTQEKILNEALAEKNKFDGMIYDKPLKLKKQ